MSKLDHPNVVRLFETFIDEARDEIHLAMELCRGGALPSYAREFWPPLEEAAAAVIMWQLLGAVSCRVAVKEVRLSHHVKGVYIYNI